MHLTTATGTALCGLAACRERS